MNPLLIRLIVYASICAGLVGFGALTMHRHDQARYDALKADFDAFRGGVAALGKAAQDRATKQAAEDRTRKEQADAENRRSTDSLRADIKRLRDAADRARPSGLPSAPAGSSRPDLLCLDRAEYQREDGILTERLLQGARGLADEGSKNTVDLNTAREWAGGVRPESNGPR